GVHLEGDRLRISPCIPADWPGFEITYRYRSATYHIQIVNSAKELAASTLTLVDDGAEHSIVITSNQPVTD
ncbi:MAG TPA: glycosyl hydrolase family 65 protein, partial [Acidobacteriota bacterium]|nr:glycosyl hydrolase family 65 protein [Acidobacteriota bacterium]